MLDGPYAEGADCIDADLAPCGAISVVEVGAVVVAVVVRAVGVGVGVGSTV